MVLEGDSSVGAALLRQGSVHEHSLMHCDEVIEDDVWLFSGDARS